MKIDFSDILNKKEQLEDEKILFGGEIYQYRHSLPHITIDLSNNEDYRMYVSRVKKVADQFGADICHLFAELCLLYNIVDDSDIKNPVKLSIQQIGSHILGKIALAMLQAKKIEEKILASDDCEILGEEYCFIAIMLQDLFNTYSFMISFLSRKRYLNEQFIISIKERLTFLISGAFEELKEMFMVVQGYDSIEKTIDFNRNNTLH